VNNPFGAGNSKQKQFMEAGTKGDFVVGINTY
jgi:hypothetical protein